MCCTYECRQGRNCDCVFNPCGASQQTPQASGMKVLPASSTAAGTHRITLQRVDWLWIAFSLLVFCASLYGLFQLG